MKPADGGWSRTASAGCEDLTQITSNLIKAPPAIQWWISLEKGSHGEMHGRRFQQNITRQNEPMQENSFSPAAPQRSLKQRSPLKG